MQNRYETITVDSVIARTKAQLRLTHTSDYDSYLEMMVFEALDSLGGISQMVKKQCGITVSNGISKLPKDFVKLIGIRATVVQQTNDPIQAEFNRFNYLLYANTRFLNSCGVNVDGVANGGYQINNGYIHMNCGDIVITDAVLAYYGINTDAEGRALIYARYERALSSYACYMYAMAYAENYNQYIIEEYKRTWQLQRSKLTGEDNAYDFQLEKRQIMNIWNALTVSRSENFLGQ